MKGVTMFCWVWFTTEYTFHRETLCKDFRQCNSFYSYICYRQILPVHHRSAPGYTKAPEWFYELFSSYLDVGYYSGKKLSSSIEVGWGEVRVRKSSKWNL